MSFEVPPPPDPEIHYQIKLKCYCCKKDMLTTYKNTAYFVYPKQPWFNHTRTVCKKGGVNIFFVDVSNEEAVDYANQFVKATSPNGFCDDNEYLEFYRSEKGITDLVTHELTEEEQRLVDFTHFVMESAHYITDI